MNKQALVTGIVQDIIRIGNSRNGNPKFTVALADGRTFPTKPDASISYEIDNLSNCKTEVDLLLDGWGRVIDAAEAGQMTVR